jgi:hypothetical protein
MWVSYLDYAVRSILGHRLAGCGLAAYRRLCASLCSFAPLHLCPPAPCTPHRSYTQKGSITKFVGAGGSHFPEVGGFGAGVGFVDAGGDLGESDVGAGDGRGEGGDGEQMSKRIFSNDTHSHVLVFPSRSYSIAK